MDFSRCPRVVFQKIAMKRGEGDGRSLLWGKGGGALRRLKGATFASPGGSDHSGKTSLFSKGERKRGQYEFLLRSSLQVPIEDDQKG